MKGTVLMIISDNDVTVENIVSSLLLLSSPSKSISLMCLWDGRRGNIMHEKKGKTQSTGQSIRISKLIASPQTSSLL